MALNACLTLISCASLWLLPSVEASTNTPPPKPDGEPGFSDNYIYDNIINGSSYKRNQLPTNRTVVTSFAIESVSRIDTKKGLANVIAAVRMWWVDERLKYPKGSLSQGVPGLNVRKSDVWWPEDVAVLSAASVNSLDGQTSPFVRVQPDGSCYSTVVKSYALVCPMLVQDFPFDVQTCVITLEPWLHAAALVKVVGSGGHSGLLAKNPPPKSNPTSLEFQLLDGGFEHYTTGTGGIQYTSINFYLKLKRYPKFYVDTLVIPVVILGYISWLGLFIDRKAAPARVGLGVTVALTQAALQIPVATYVPVNHYGTWLGGFQSTAFVCAAVLICEYAIVNYYMTRKRKTLERFLWLLAWALEWHTSLLQSEDELEEEKESDPNSAVTCRNTLPGQDNREPGVGIGVSTCMTRIEQAVEVMPPPPPPPPLSEDFAHNIDIFARVVYFLFWTLYVVACFATLPNR